MFGVVTGGFATGGGIKVLSLLSIAFLARSSCSSFCLRSVELIGSLEVVCGLSGSNAGSSGTSRIEDNVDSRFSRRTGYRSSF